MGNKRYMLFASNTHYPEGGGFDYQSEHETIIKAMDSHDLNKYEYDGGMANIFDTKTKKVVKILDDRKWFNSYDDVY